MKAQDIDPLPDHPMGDLPGPATAKPKRRQLVVPLRPGLVAVLYVPYPMTEGDWDQFMSVLAAMKPGLVPAPALGEAQGGPQ